MQNGSRERGHDFCLAMHGDMVFAVPVAGLVKVLAATDCDLRSNRLQPLLGWAEVTGARVPVARLDVWLDGMPAAAAHGEHVVVVDTGAGLLGLAVDGVRGLATILETEIRPPASDCPRVVAGIWPQRSYAVHILAPAEFAAEARRWGEHLDGGPPAQAITAAAAARTQGYCLFERRGRHFGVAVLAAREVVSGEPLTPVPQAPEHVLGVINLRGNLLPVINVDVFLGLPASVVPASYEALVVEGAGVQLGLFVDRVGDVRPIDLAEVRPAPGADAARSIYRGVWPGPLADVFLVDVDEIVARAVDATTRSFERTVAALSGLEEDSDAVADTPS